MHKTKTRSDIMLDVESVGTTFHKDELVARQRCEFHHSLKWKKNKQCFILQLTMGCW